MDLTSRPTAHSGTGTPGHIARLVRGFKHAWQSRLPSHGASFLEHVDSCRRRIDSHDKLDSQKQAALSITTSQHAWLIAQAAYMSGISSGSVSRLVTTMTLDHYSVNRP